MKDPITGYPCFMLRKVMLMFTLQVPFFSQLVTYFVSLFVSTSFFPILWCATNLHLDKPPLLELIISFIQVDESMKLMEEVENIRKVRLRTMFNYLKTFPVHTTASYMGIRVMYRTFLMLEGYFICIQ
jgi:hypothetical protein